MPKKGRSRAGDRTVLTRVPFRYAISTVKSTTGDVYTETDLTTTNLGGRIADMAWDFEYFRLTKLSAYSVLSHEPGTVASAGTSVFHGVAFDETPAAYVGTVNSVSRLASFKHAALGPKEVRPEIHVSAKDFAVSRPMKWFHTQATGSPDASEASAGFLVHWVELNTQTTLGSAAVAYCVISGMCEFSEAVDPTLSMERRGALFVPTSVKDDPDVVAQVARLKKVVSMATNP